MNFPDLKDIQKTLKTVDLSGFEKVNLVIARNITVDGLLPYIRYVGVSAGLDINIVQSEYDVLALEALNPGSTLFSDADIILVFHFGETVAPGIFAACPTLAPEELKDSINSLEVQFASIVAGLRQQSDAMILWAGLEMPVEPAFGIADQMMENGQAQTVSRLNQALRESLQEIGNAFLVDMNRLVSKAGANGFYDNRTWAIARAPYGVDGYVEIAKTVGRYIRALKGKNKKCLVLDCDNVLWGGVVGEAGIKGIKVSQDFPGNNYQMIQQFAANLYHRGIILALCSKNNEEDVWEVFDTHQGMVLERHHIAAWRINWQDKASNLVQIAEELNIGLDSLVFVDDSIHEIELVRSMVPEVEVVHLDHKNLARSVDSLMKIGLFDSLSVTEEDRKRGRMYKENADRNRSVSAFENMDDYLGSLKTVVEMDICRAESVARVAQLTQKTNQFNLTTRRYNESQIEEIIESDNQEALSCTVMDRFGDYGLVGVCLLKYRDDVAEIDTLLLSCRVLGRGVEAAFLSAIASWVLKAGKKELIGIRIPTPKNIVTENYLPQAALLEQRVQEDGVELFRYDLGEWELAPPAHIDLKWQ